MVGEDISFDKFLTNLKLDEKNYILALQCILLKPTLFFKCNPKDIRTNVFDKHTKPLWEANIDA